MQRHFQPYLPVACTAYLLRLGRLYGMKRQRQQGWRVLHASLEPPLLQLFGFPSH